jgi:rifampicin phosphotransferase
VRPKETEGYVVWLDRIDSESDALVGSKAAKLARLAQNGFPVPDGFCVTVQAYHDFLDSLGAMGAIVGNGAQRARAAEPILSSPLPPMLRAKVLEAYGLMRRRHGAEVKVAVRSSASVEDLPSASFAGQYTSVLNVAGEASLMKAVRKCWASACSAQVHAYQEQHELDSLEVHMAVIVQVMVPAELAGVLFTTDPLGRDPTQMVVEMTAGLGDSVAAGTTMPLYYTVSKRTGALVAPDHVATQHLDGVLHGIDWKPLGRLALQIEALFQSPQDIEWAYSDQTFWVLQSRPITTLRERRPRQIWTRANAGEILPNIVSPLTWSVFAPMLRLAGLYRSLSPLTIHWKWQHPCGTWPDSPRLFMGRAYMELASVYAGFGNMPGVTPEILHRMLGFEFHLCTAAEFPKRRPRWHVMDPYRALRFWLEMLGVTHTLVRGSRKWLVQVASSHSTTTDTTVDVAPDSLLRQIEQLLPETAKILGLHIQCTSVAFSAFGLLDRLLKTCTEPKEAQAFEAGLVADFQDISTVQQGVAIWDLAQAVSRVPCAARALHEIGAADEVVASWRNCSDAADLVRLWDSFIAHFGDRSTQEFELAIAHWDADPSFVLQTIREILDHDRPDPRKRLSKQQERGSQNTEHMVQHVSQKGSPWQAWYFRRLCATYRELVPLRENLKYGLVSRFNALRKMFITLGRILEKESLVSTCDDVFFLSYEEIVDLARNHSQPSFVARDLVAQRKAEQQEYAQSHVSDVWVSVDGQATPMELPTGQGADILQGIGCSPGQITGRACVLASVQENLVVAPGQILVAPSLDPGLTPLFLSAGGLVTEIGGMLSHGAIVAREYGLPAVVGVPNATRLVQNGQQITVDGFTGRIHLGPMQED